MKQYLRLLKLMNSFCATEPYFDHSHLPDWHDHLHIQETIFEEKKDDYHFLIFRNKLFGYVVALNGEVRLHELDEPSYHEMLVHVPLMTHAHPRHILILGGSDGGALREVLKHSTIQQVTLVTDETSMIEHTKKHLPHLSLGAFDHPKVKNVSLSITDFLSQTDQKFDVIICDPLLESKELLYTRPFYESCKQKLNVKGIVVHYNTSITHDQLQPFNVARTYLITLPSCQSVFMRGSSSFRLMTDTHDYQKLSKKELQKRIKRVQGEMQYYNPDIHKASFALPEYIKPCS